MPTEESGNKPETEGRSKSGEVARRILTAAVALALIVPVVFWGGVIGVQIVVGAAAVAGMWEFGGMMDPPASTRNRIFAAGLALLPIFAAPYGDGLWVASLAAACLSVPVAAVIRPGKDLNGGDARVTGTLFGVVYLGFLMSFMSAVRGLGMDGDQPWFGLEWLCLVLAAVWLGDTGAFFVGSKFGKHKLAPIVSPGKTWEGAAGGLVSSMLAGGALALVVRLAFGHDFPFWHALPAAALAGLFGQLGDLAESMLKRGAGVKDSGNLFPGHGGMLDRLDSLLFAFPAVYFYARYVV